MEKKIVIIDGQGGRIGAMLVEQIKKLLAGGGQTAELVAIGTNGIATAAMLKAGANHGATGENPVLVASRDADVIVGPIGIVVADSLLGEVTPAMAAAVGQSPAQKVLLPVNRCNNHIVGAPELPLAEMVALAVQSVQEALRQG